MTACYDPWVPAGDAQGVIGKETCEPFSLDQRMREAGSDMDLQKQVLDGYFKNCENDLKVDGPDGSILQVIKAMAMRYDVQKHRSFQKIEFTLSQGFKVPAFAMIRPGTEKYPLVIFQCGIQCDTTSEAFGGYGTHLFDESPFHLILLPSSSSGEMQKLNRTVSLGGFDEGLRLLEIALKARTELNFSNRVSSVHLYGTSLGGQSVLYSSLYNNYLKRPDGGKIVDSALVGCPVVDLQPTVEALYSGGVVSDHLYQSLVDQLKSVQDAVPDVSHQIDFQLKRPDIRYGAKLIASAAVLSRIAAENRGIPPSVFDLSKLPKELQPKHFINEQEFWNANRFQNFAKLLSDDVFIIAARNDKIVKPKMNTAVLEVLANEQSLSNIRSVYTDRGMHCNWDLSYGHNVFTSFLKNLILAKSPEMGERFVKETFDLSQFQSSASLKISRSLPRKSLEWKVDPGASEARMIEVVRVSCPATAGSRPEPGYKCNKNIESKVPLRLFGIDQESQAHNEVEAQGLTRFLNASAQVQGLNGGALDRYVPAVQVTISRYK